MSQMRGNTEFIARSAIRLGAVIVAAVLVHSPARATYSIVAADSGSRQVGGAVTSCVAPQSVNIVYRPAPGHGAIHAQAAANTAGRDRGVTLLQADTPPADIVTQITATSFDPNFQSRQYGVVDLSGRAAGFTGTSAMQYREDRQGTVGSFVYSVQGNILTSARVLDQAEGAFKARGCDLAERLMLALEAGAQNGEGDSRCTSAYKLPSDSASLEVDREGEAAGAYLRLEFTSAFLVHENPIVQLRTQFDAWRKTHPCPSAADGGTSDSGVATGGASASGGSGGVSSGGAGGALTGGASSMGGATSMGGASSGVGGVATGGANPAPTTGGSLGSGGIPSNGGVGVATGGAATAPNNDESGCSCHVHHPSGRWSVVAGVMAILLVARRRVAHRRAR